MGAWSKWFKDIGKRIRINNFQMAPYFGFHPLLKEILIGRAQEALQDEVKMNCDMCQYRLEAMEHIDHHHHHDHDHDHDHHDHHDHDHDHDHDHEHDHEHDHKHDTTYDHRNMTMLIQEVTNDDFRSCRYK